MKNGFQNEIKPFASATVERMALRREKRVLEQRELLACGGDERCVVCIGMNIAGPDKRGGLIDAAFFEAVSRFIDGAGIGEKLLSDDENGFALRFINENTGIEALIALDADAEELKRICVEIEETHPVGRLFDMDVIAKNGVKLGRTEPRKCLICSENASICARSRAHSVGELQKRTGELLAAHFSCVLADAAENALVAEVNVTPKPGLVDALNSGANADMDASTFHRSAKALRPFFARMAEVAIDYCVNEKTTAITEKFLDALKNAGIEAEHAMLRATGGVNTHRGAVYSLGLLVCAAAYNLAKGVFGADESGLRGGSADGYDFIKSCSETAAAFAHLLGDNSVSTSNGARMRRKYGVGGPVQQAQEGFPLALLAKTAKAEYYNRRRQADVNLAWAYALLCVMAVMDDNNALKRGGEQGALLVKKRAAELKTLAETAEPDAFRAALLEFDAELIKLNVSCGGAADMLALALFLEGLEEAYAPVFAMPASSETYVDDKDRL